MNGITGLARIVDRDDGTVPVCEIRGELDASNVEAVFEHLVNVVANDAPGVALDLSKTSYLDSAGVRILFELGRRLRARRQELRVAVPRDGIVRRVLVLTALGDIVPIDEEIDESVRALEART